MAGRAARGQGAHRHRVSDLGGAERRQVLQARRAHRRRPRARAARLGRRGAHAEENDLGVALVDIGGGTTDLVVFHGGAVRHTAMLPLGGGHLTNDIAAGLRTPTAEAEKIKQRFGCALANVGRRAPRRSRCRASAAASRACLSRQILAEIIEPRVEEIFALVAREIVALGLRGAARLRRRADRRHGAARGHRPSRRAGVPPAGPARRAAVRSAGSPTSWRARSTRPASASLLDGAAAVGGQRQHDGRLWSRVRHRMSELVREFF